jgi:hypothetical protein
MLSQSGTRGKFLLNSLEAVFYRRGQNHVVSEFFDRYFLNQRCRIPSARWQAFQISSDARVGFSALTRGKYLLQLLRYTAMPLLFFLFNDPAADRLYVGWRSGLDHPK